MIVAVVIIGFAKTCLDGIPVETQRHERRNLSRNSRDEYGEICRLNHERGLRQTGHDRGGRMDVKEEGSSEGLEVWTVGTTAN